MISRQTAHEVGWNDFFVKYDTIFAVEFPFRILMKNMHICGYKGDIVSSKSKHGYWPNNNTAALYLTLLYEP